METMIEIRSYTKSELATMYFPIGSASNALRRLNRYIHHAHGLLPALLATGYRVNDRHFTRRQVHDNRLFLPYFHLLRVETLP